MNYDLAIVGAGSAAFAAAIHARRKQFRVIMVERDQIGGNVHTWVAGFAGGWS